MDDKQESSNVVFIYKDYVNCLLFIRLTFYLFEKHNAGKSGNFADQSQNIPWLDFVF
jgi:hypothetical protein